MLIIWHIYAQNTYEIIVCVIFMNKIIVTDNMIDNIIVLLYSLNEVSQ